MTSCKWIILGVAAALLLAGVPNAARGQVPGGSFGVGGELRGLTTIQGHVVCVGCSLDEVQKTQPALRHLYQWTHRQGRLVFQVSTIDGLAMWAAPLSPRFTVRCSARVFGQLTAEENLMKELEITGWLRNTGTLDIAAVTILS
jgi:hypothetical protein